MTGLVRNLIVAIGWIGSLLFAITAVAEPRKALVVGNAAYGTVSPLNNAVADARLVSAALTAKGFEVTVVTDADQITLNRAIAQFGRELRASGEETTGLFYYAGHAVQSFGANYLLPTDVALTDAADLSLVAVRADAVLRQMASAENRANIVVLDACRNNPFVDIPDMNDNGLAEMKAPTGSFVAYSTAPGDVAFDGVGSNSPFTAALVREMDTPGLTVEQAFKRVRASVLEETDGLQTPWDMSSLTTDVVFTPKVEESPEKLAADRFFASIQTSRDPVQIVLFLRTYPESEHFDAARTLLTEAIEAGQDSPSTQTTSERSTANGGVAAANPRERELINAARLSGDLEDYRKYLAEFPTGVFAELAAMEIAEKAAKDPDAPAEGLVAAATDPTTSSSIASAATREPMDVTLETVIDQGDPALSGFTIASLIKKSPLFPPIEGLPEQVWKDQPCSTCHEWTPDALCTQANTYLSESGTRALGKEHPFGGGFKNALRDWAHGGCR